MKFYSKVKHQIVFIGKGQSVQFINGEFETKDSKIINKLINRYKHDEEPEEIPEEEATDEDPEEEAKTDYSKMDIKELKKAAKEKGIKGYSTKDKKQLMEMLNGE